MSYILEALKKAQTERQLGSTPGLHDLPPPAAVRVPAARSRAALALGALLCLASGVLAVRMLLPGDARPLPPAAPAEVAPPVMAAAAPPARAIPPKAVPAPAPIPVPVPVPETASAVVREQPAAEAVPTAAPAAPAADPDEALPALGDLPQSVRGAIPKLAFGGYIYSPVPSERLLLIDNNLRREGEELGAGLMLERLLPTAAVINFRGTRFRIPY